MRQHPDPNCVLKVGDGRGFIIMPLPPLKPGLKTDHALKGVSFLGQRLMLTTAHCLPHLPPAQATASSSDRTYKGLIETLDGSRKDISAECMFVDPVADIAVLGCPDTEEFGDEA
jgi:hypothetical protein